ncbi:acyltransferase family protein [Micromonospora sp. NPDC049559]|uniref:acyltransferase family protein n=1 Tax=Micromonospora sp. NPDC049559 TaxID=3155923 RepID=UPI00341DEF59
MTGDDTGTTKPYLAGLDGLRAIAVTAVVLYHLFPALLPGGFVGVDVFFVISGFLITTLLLAEHARTGRVRLREFWVRRARRLLPALFLVIGVASSVALLVGGDVLVGLDRQIVGAGTFTNNWLEMAAGSDYFDATTLHVFTNFWSLAVEEQFYAVWPFVVVGLLGLPVLAWRHRAGALTALLLALGSAAWMAVVFDGANATRVHYGTDTHAVGLMLGAALAFRRDRRHATPTGDPGSGPARRRLTQALGLLSLAALVGLMIWLPERAAVTYRGGLALASLLTAVVIVASVGQRGVLRRLLESAPLRWLGLHSYGIYLWHWPVIVLLRHALPADVPGSTTALVAGVATLAAAAASYRHLEEPVRRLGVRAFLRRGVRKEAIVAGRSGTGWRLPAHPFLLVACALVAMTTAAVVGAPATTQAQRQVAEGQRVIAHAGPVPARRPEQHPAATSTPPAPLAPQPYHPITGSSITLVGDSVALASAGELQARFPGIYIDAKVSRSMRQGGLETIERLRSAGSLRRVLVVALGTNGAFGDGNLDRLLSEVGKERKVVFVTAHAARDWVRANNDALRAVVGRYPNVRVAEWDAAIRARPGGLASDGIHPNRVGVAIYADCVQAALAQMKQ